MTIFPRGDEREQAIELAGDRLAYLVLAFGILAVVMYRSLILNQASWELLAIVVLSGVVKFGYRLRRGAMSADLALPIAVALALAALLAVILVLVRSAV